MHPFLKWAGGKSWLFRDNVFQMPEFEGLYREPFLGGGAAFFAHNPKRAFLSDANSDLIELYRVIQSKPVELLDNLKEHSALHSTEYYYKIREETFAGDVDRAAQFLYLNRMCWNGLYRVNNKGKFNVPIGSKKRVLLDSDDFQGWSKRLKNIKLDVLDFEVAIDKSEAGDLIFADPPYTVRHNLNGFIKYNQKIFLWEDQIRLQKSLKRAVDRGVKFVLTNADHHSIHELYADFAEIKTIERRSSIAAKNKFRGKYSEVIITSL
jgi:DNA adenine methylase